MAKNALVKLWGSLHMKIKHGSAQWFLKNSHLVTSSDICSNSCIDTKRSAVVQSVTSETKSTAYRNRHQPKVALTPQNIQDTQTRLKLSPQKKSHFVDSPKKPVSLKQPFFKTGSADHFQWTNDQYRTKAITFPESECCHFLLCGNFKQNVYRNNPRTWRSICRMLYYTSKVYFRDAAEFVTLMRNVPQCQLVLLSAAKNIFQVWTDYVPARHCPKASSCTSKTLSYCQAVMWPQANRWSSL
jgi:hypothetical protein